MTAGDDDPALEQTAASGNAPGAELATLDASAGPTVAAPVDGLPEIAASRYEMGGEVGRGGLGRVLRARDRVLQRAVAIKELLGADDGGRRRFVREAMITARLQHPSIVPVYEAGRWRDRAPFYAMKLVAGRPLADAIEETRTLEARLALVPTVLAVADAIAYAHSERVIHRDLKPGNVLVGAFGETVVIDWGLAKDLAIDDHDALDAGPFREAASDQTAAGAVLGTPAYIAPEQAAGEDVDEHADVYAIGAMLYHVIAGVIPHQGSTLDVVIRRVLAGEITPLSVREPRAPADLATIVTKAMARDPARRYPTAKELADDLRRFQTGQLVGAHRYTLGERVRRWVRRHRGVTVVATVAAVVLLAYGTWSISRILAETSRADRERDQAIAKANQALLAQAHGALDRDPTEALAALRGLDPNGPGWSTARLLTADALSRPRIVKVIESLPLPGPRTRPTISGDGRWYVAWDDSALSIVDLEHVTVRRFALVLPKLDQGGTLVPDDASWPQFCDDGQHLAVHGRLDGAADDRLIEIDLARGTWSVADPGVDVQAGYARCRARRRFIIREHTLLAWDPPSSRFVRVAPTTATEVIAVSSDGEHAVTLEGAALVRWSRAGPVSRAPVGEDFSAVGVSDDCTVVLDGAGNAIWHLDPVRRVELPDDYWRALLPDGSRAVESSDFGIELYDADTGAQVSRLSLEGTAASDHVELSDDGAWLFVRGDDISWALHLKGSGAALRVPDEVKTMAQWVGSRLITFGIEGHLHVWSFDDAQAARVAAPIPLRPPGPLVWEDGTLSRTDRGTTIALETIDVPRLAWKPSPDHHLASSPDGRWAALGVRGQATVLVDLATWQRHRLDGSSGAGVCFLPDGQVVTGAPGGGLLRWQPADRTHHTLVEPSEYPYGADMPFAIACAPDGATVAVGGRGRIAIVDVETGARRQLDDHHDAIWDLRFAGDGSELFGLDEWTHVAVWDVASGFTRTFPTSHYHGTLRVENGVVMLETRSELLPIVDDLPREPAALREFLHAIPGVDDGVRPRVPTRL